MVDKLFNKKSSETTMDASPIKNEIKQIWTLIKNIIKINFTFSYIWSQFFEYKVSI